MGELTTVIDRPQRWDVPFGPDMIDADVTRLMSIEPFVLMDEGAFPSSTPLRDILLNDTRIVRFHDGDIVVRKGDYGSSAFLILSGAARVVVEDLPGELLGRRQRQKLGWLKALSQLWTNARTVEYRDTSKYGKQVGVASRGTGTNTRVFLQDVPDILDKYNTVELGAGEVFGELAALGRSPRTATVFTQGNTEMLEIRWQGLRDIRRRAEQLKQHIDKVYRERSLVTHLNETYLFDHLTKQQLQDVADATEFESHGDFEWFGSYKRLREETAARRLAKEPMFAEQGHYPNGLILIRAGFARVSRKFGHGEQTIAYLGKGQYAGLRELTHNFKHHDQVPLQTSLRAVGHVDILRIPTRVIERFLLPSLRPEDMPEPIEPEPDPDAGADVPLPVAPEAVQTPSTIGEHAPIDTGILEFLVEYRYINGTKTMMIDLDRCVRCDDCVRACAASHDNNPRFVRHGRQYDHYMIANACQHCQDPMCMIGCPTGAIARDPLGGQVVINDNTCIGCSTCANSGNAKRKGSQLSGQMRM